MKIFGEEGEGKEDPRSFSAKPLRTRAGILAAGVTMNFILALVLLIFAHAIGIPAPVPEGADRQLYRDIRIRIVAIIPKSPAEKAGFIVGDAIEAIQAGDTVARPQSIKDVQKIVRDHAGDTLTFTVRRGDEAREIVANVRAAPPEGEGPIGFAMETVGLRRYPFFAAISEGAKTTFLLAALIIRSFYDLVKNFILGVPTGEYIAGPVGIYAMTRQFTQLGFVYLVQFTALLSLTLAILNSVPYPALDGGQMLYLAIEKVKGSPLSDRTRRWANAFGFASLMVLILLITIRDIQKFF
ncbi:MAG: site-2 protease family protein [Parcubacteria group bacterium]|nr:site-2 protease family protein [Parcubacteria group bacterium]